MLPQEWLGNTLQPSKIPENYDIVDQSLQSHKHSRETRTN